MNMGVGEKLWLDRYLYETPLLTYNEEDLDYTAIMARFHYLLLKKDKETYEEIVKYWAILIITAPDAFDDDENNHYKYQTFSKVRDSAIKLNRPIEKIELPPGQPELEQAENFRYENWKPFFDEKYSRDWMDDLEVFRWYTDPANTIAARGFFGAYCMHLLGAYTRKPFTLVKFYAEIYRCDEYAGYGSYKYRSPYRGRRPPRRISFNLGTATFLRHAFRSQIETFRKVLRVVLDWYEYHVDRDADIDRYRRRFFLEHVQPNLIYYGLNIMNFAKTYLVDSEAWLELESLIENTGSDEFILALKSLNTIVDYVNGVRLQDGTYLKQMPQVRGENCRFWQYSRLFSPLYFKTLADEDNLAILYCFMGYKGVSKDEYANSSCLDNFIEDEATKESGDKILKDMDEQIERGWDEGVSMKKT